MGLDQYLYAKRYISGAEYNSAEQRAKFSEVMWTVPEALPHVDDHMPHLTIEVNVGYWQKANAIHLWFVNNCQGGNDDCRRAYVSREQLDTLRSKCEEVIESPARAEEVLPTTDGFFFGGTDYDAWYFSALNYTAKTITKLLTMPNEWDFYYSSSW